MDVERFARALIFNVGEIKKMSEKFPLFVSYEEEKSLSEGKKRK